MKFKKIKINFYRYQLVPLTQKIQARIDQQFDTIDDLKNKKNKFLYDVLTNAFFKFRSEKEKINHKIEYSDESNILMKINVRKKAKLGTKDFRERDEEDYPQTILYFNNNKNHQILAIQDNKKAFSNHRVIAHIIEKNVEPLMNSYNLAFYLEPLYIESEFWDVIKRYEKRITWMRFELIKPNISNISGLIKDGLDIISSKTNTHTTAIELHAPQKGILENLNKENEAFNAIVEYDLNGGGKQPEIKIGKARKKIKTKNSERSIDLEDIRIKGRTPAEVSKIFNSLTNI
jgi:hypothetical protein